MTGSPMRSVPRVCDLVRALAILPCPCGAPGPHRTIATAAGGEEARCSACRDAEALQDDGQNLADGVHPVAPVGREA